MSATRVPNTGAVPARVRWRALRYGLTLTGPILAWLGLWGHGWWCWALPLHAFVVIPVGELLLRPDHLNLTAEEEEAALRDPVFDLMLYLMVPVQWATLFLFCWTIPEPALTHVEMAGRILTMGIMCGVYGINVAHELGHRAERWERDLARALLLTSLYMHFIVEHNRGHHRRVGTPDDPASARYGEPIFAFWLRTIVFSFRSAWRIEVDRMRKEGRSPLGVHNEMVRSLAIEAAFLVALHYVFGAYVLGCFLGAALIGVLLLETVNYIEHYGLGRSRNTNGSYGRVQHYHSWNSDHPIGRLMLFELTRHSDHHWKASKKYQVLQSVGTGPQLPTGYPGMMLLSLIPPLWFAVVHPRIAVLEGRYPDLVRARGAT